MLYSGSPELNRRRTSLSICLLETDTSKAGSVQAGSRRTHSGLSHSCERPTSISPAPRAQTISVALARRETIRTLYSLSCGLAQAIEDGIAPEDCNGVNGVAQHLIAVERYASQVTFRQTADRQRI